MNSPQLEACQNLADLSSRYERFKNRLPFPDYLARRIISAYNEVLFLGLIDDDQDKERLKNEIKNLKRQNLRLREQLGIQEEIDKPPETFQSDVEEND